MELVFATGNSHKLKEVRNLLPAEFTLLSLKDLECEEDIPETGHTIQENALIKARYISDKFGMNCFADDTGLEVDALDGRPGVYSARFAGPHAQSEDNVLKLLTELKGIENRKARFRTVIAMYLEGKEYTFEGIINGTITNEVMGEKGFGYDPVFKPDGHDRTFAEMTESEKNSISHRGLAMAKLVVFLNSKF